MSELIGRKKNGGVCQTTTEPPQLAEAGLGTILYSLRIPREGGIRAVNHALEQGS
jgi:hypothetical protein